MHFRAKEATKNQLQALAHLRDETVAAVIQTAVLDYLTEHADEIETARAFAATVEQARAAAQAAERNG